MSMSKVSDADSSFRSLRFDQVLTQQLTKRERPVIKRYQGDSELSNYLKHPFVRLIRWYHTYLLIVAFILIGSLSLNAQLSVFYSLFAVSTGSDAKKFFSIVFGVFLAGICSCFLVNSGRLIQDVWQGKDFLELRKLFDALHYWANTEEAYVMRDTNKISRLERQEKIREKINATDRPPSVASRDSNIPENRSVFERDDEAGNEAELEREGKKKIVKMSEEADENTPLLPSLAAGSSSFNHQNNGIEIRTESNNNNDSIASSQDLTQVNPSGSTVVVDEEGEEEDEEDAGEEKGEGGEEIQKRSKGRTRRKVKEIASEFWQGFAVFWDVLIIQSLLVITGLDILPIVLALFYCKGDILNFATLFMSVSVFMACFLNVFCFVLEVLNVIGFLLLGLYRMRWIKILPIPLLVEKAGYIWRTRTIIKELTPAKKNWICFHITINTDAILVKLLLFGAAFSFLIGCCVSAVLDSSNMFIAEASFLFFVLLYWGFNRLWEKGFDFLQLQSNSKISEIFNLHNNVFLASATITPIFLLIALIFMTYLCSKYAFFWLFINWFISLLYLIPYVIFFITVYPKAKMAHSRHEAKKADVQDDDTYFLEGEDVQLIRALEKFQTFQTRFTRILFVGFPVVALMIIFCFLLIFGGGTVWLSLGTAFFTIFLIVLVAGIIIFVFQKFPTKIFITFYLILCGLSIALYGALQLYVSENDFGVNPVAAIGPPIVPPNPVYYRYEVCSMSWFGLSILDFAYFSNLAYQNEEVVDQDLHVWFNGEGSEGGWEVKAKFTDQAAVQFYEFYNEKLDISIVSVRGTQTLLDAVQDLDLWLSVVVLQGTDLFFPTISVWPTRLSQILVAVSSVNYWINPDLNFFYDPLLNHLNSINSSQILLTGHSLGGGISKIASALTNITSVTFSSPGIHLSRLKFGISEEQNLSLGFVNIEPDHDIVPMVDDQTGISQKIKCESTPLQCHSLQRSTIVLSKSCGDPLGRGFVTSLLRQKYLLDV